MTVGVRWPSTETLAAELAGLAHRCGGLLIASDFDGTLAPIVARPEAAQALPRALEALRRLSAGGSAAGTPPLRVAILTTRDSDDVAARLTLGPQAVIVGNAGLERWVDGHVELDPVVETWRPVLDRAQEELEAALAAGRCPGARLERRRSGVVVHTRGAHRSTADAEAVELTRERAAATGLRLVVGKRAYELRIPVERDKADALAVLRFEAPWDRAAVCAAGDDLPDLEMLSLAASLPDGMGIAVADSESPPALLDVADVAVEGPWAWAEVLGGLAQALTRG